MSPNRKIRACIVLLVLLCGVTAAAGAAGVSVSDGSVSTIHGPTELGPVTAGMPDLAIYGCSIIGMNANRRPVQVAVSFSNDGDAESGEFTFDVYLSTDPEITPSDIVIYSGTHPGIPAHTVYFPWTPYVDVPGSVPGGNYYWGIIADGQNLIAESNEMNNVAFRGPFLMGDPPVAAIPGSAPPTDTNNDGKYDDVNGNGRQDFADVVLYFNQMTWIAANEPVSAFDFNGNSRIDFADVVWLFNHL